jgi:hypothetical protein
MSYFSSNQVVYVNSNNRASGSHTDFQIKLDVNNNIDWDKVCVLDCSIPKSAYTVSSTSNTFTLTEFWYEYTVTLAVGNYTRKSLATALAAALTVASGNLLITYTCTYPVINNSVDNGKFTISITGNEGYQPVISVGSSRIYELLGFDKNSSNVFVSNSLTSTNVCNLSPETTIQIKSDICNTFNSINLQSVIGNSDPSYSSINFTNHAPAEYAVKANIKGDNIFTFRLTDENDILYETNGLNIVINLMLFTIKH